MGKHKKTLLLLKNLDARIKNNPGDVEALMQKGFLYFEPLHRTGEAVEIFENIVKLNPKNDDAYYWLATVLYKRLGNDCEAEKLLRQALQLNSNNAKVHYLMMFILNTLGKSAKEAAEHLKTTAQLEPTWLLPRISLSYEFLDKNLIDAAEQEIFAAYELFKNLKVPALTTPMEHYLEDHVTGRTSCTQKDFDRLFEKISEARGKQKN